MRRGPGPERYPYTRRELLLLEKLSRPKGGHAKSSLQNVEWKVSGHPTRLAWASASDATRLGMEALVYEYPDAPRAELRRFLDARRGVAEDARAMYRKHRKWRKAEALLEESRAALKDDCFCTVGGVDANGDIVVLVEGARYDTTAGAETHVAAICAALDGVLGPESTTRVVALIDVRAGKGWRNPPATQLLGFLRLVCGVVPDNYPERLRAVVVFNLPRLVTWIAHVALRLVDKITRDKVVLFHGSDGKHAPCPDGLAEHVAHLGLIPEHARARFDKLPPDPAAPAPVDDDDADAQRSEAPGATDDAPVAPLPEPAAADDGVAAPLPEAPPATDGAAAPLPEPAATADVAVEVD
ncbi:hypothetical protein M885DRAFT_526012 [Pelagophyceae sp. CCMP2097]|nr:hypothetical protein M885DRAFT_526012 [Pelagophyceae sp. CCMP2097]